MVEINSDYIDQLIAGLPDNIAEISNSLSSCFEDKIRLEQTDTGNWIGEVPIAGGDGPGLLVAFRLENQGIVVAVPESLPLPAWYNSPGDSESARLQTLAMEWSMNLLPRDVEVSEFATLAVGNVREAIDAAQPDASAQFVVFERTLDEADSKATGKICLIGPVSLPPVPSLTTVEPMPEPAHGGELVNPPLEFNPQGKSPIGSSEIVPRPPSGRAVKRPSPLLGLPVHVVVMLAEKKIELGQLLELSPGSLISFDKSCDSLLDLYVNNQIYCRGEAIKIGEHFGLKVNEVRPKAMRPKKVL